MPRKTKTAPISIPFGIGGWEVAERAETGTRQRIEEWFYTFELKWDNTTANSRIGMVKAAEAYAIARRHDETLAAVLADLADIKEVVFGVRAKT